MNATERELAQRKEVLLARSALLRLKLRHEVQLFRRSLTWREAGAAVIHSPPARDALFLVGAEVLGRERVARWLSQALGILGIAKLTLTLLHSMQGPSSAPSRAEPTQPGEPV